MLQNHALGGRIFDLHEGVSSGDGSPPTSVAIGIATLRKEFGDRQGLDISFARLTGARVQVLMWRAGAGTFTLSCEDVLPLRFKTVDALFEALAVITTRLAIERED